MAAFRLGLVAFGLFAWSVAAAAQAPDADALEQRATELFTAGKNAEAITALEQVRGLRHAAGQPALEARAAWRLGTAYRGAGRPADAVRVSKDAYRLATTASDTAIAAEALSQLNQLSAYLPEFPDAAHALAEAERLARIANQPKTLARILDSKARWLGELGRTDEAIAATTEGISFATAAGDNALLAGLFAIRSAFVSRNGFLADALTDALRARDAAAKVGPRAEVTALFALAQSHSHLSNTEEAIRLWTEVIDRYRAIGPPIGVAIALDARCHIQYDGGHFAESLADAQASIAAYTALNQRPLSPSYSRAAMASIRLGHDTDARKWLAEARARVVDAPDYEQVQTMTHLGLAYLMLGEADNAAAAYDRVLALGRAHGSLENEWMGQLGLGRAALVRHDPAKAIAYLNQAATIVEQLRSTIPAQELRAAYLSRRVEAHEWLAAALMMQSASPSDRYVEDAFNTAERARVRALADLLAEGRAKRRDPSKATPPRPRTRAEIAATLGPRDLLIEYLVGEQYAYGFLLTRTTLTGFALPDPQELDARVRRSLELIDHDDRDGLLRVAEEFAPALLGPAIDHLDQFDRVIVVADGPLQRLPFAALPLPDQGAYLAEKVAISTVGSGSLLDLLKRGDAPANDVLALAASAGVTENSGQVRSDRGPLQEVAGEAADAIRLLAPAGGGRAIENATELGVKKNGMAGYRIIHVAAHSLIDESFPRNSAIVLSPEGDEDGALRAAEISQIPLRADLVVLAACRTQFGRILRGEGFISLARSFMEAGARSVVASLWDVGDRDTRVLMRSFYAGIAGGLPPDRALRVAQMQMMRAGGSLGSPKVWAAFQVSGEARQPVWPARSASPIGIAVVLIALASLALLLRM